MAAIAIAALTFTAVAPASAEEADTALQITGRLVVTQPEITGTTPPDASETDYQVVTPDGTFIPIEGDTIPADSTSGADVNITATPTDAVLDAANVTATGSITASSDAGQKITAAAQAAGEPLVVATGTITAAQTEPVEGQHTLDVAVITANGKTANVTDEYLTNLVGIASDFWSEQSAGAVPAITIQRIDRFATATDGCGDTNRLWSEVAEHFGHSVYDYYGSNPNHLLVVSPKSCGNAAGYGTLGSGFAGGTLWAALGNPNDEQTLEHELGHNFSLQHSNVEDCDYPNFDGAYDGDGYDNGCTEDEYADIYDVMGMGYLYCDFESCHPNAQTPALNLNSKDRLGVISPDDAPTLYGNTDEPSTNTYTIGAASDLSGIRGLHIVDPISGEDYYVEYRNAQGRDTGSIYSLFTDEITDGNNLDRMGSGVRILKGSLAYGGSVVLPDRTSATVARLVWVTGRTFTSRTGGFSLTVNELTGPAATVDVTFGQSLPAVSGSALPTIVGTVTPGVTVTAQAGADWSPKPTRIAWQWYLGGVPIAGATASTYKVKSTDLYVDLSVVGIAFAAGHTPTSFTSDNYEVIENRSLSWTAPPMVTGTKQVGSKLSITTVGNPSPKPTVITYQWYRDFAAISKATSNTYVLTSADNGHSVYVEVKASAPGYKATAKSSTMVRISAGTFTGSALPTISGEPFVTRTLKANPSSTWAPAATAYAYQWYRNGAAISKATTQTYKLTTADKGKKIQVRITTGKSGYTSKARTSTATAAVGTLKSFAGTSASTVSGTRKVGSTLTGRPGKWTPTTSVKYTYQWYREGAAISGATKSTYKQVTSDYAKRITVRVTASKYGYAAKGSTSTMSVARTVR
ncbi:hypothetical protein [Leifsonia sp. Leaf264]|uniref:hypothetical protein n=1 Tax=Leifsonia sp. Leaf264 TaxID=1736314 RepID=UPI0006FF7A7D|nr:hypothetical protein [Leifsonia sp. Leaf264]KQO98705.1 hypothetical protein ASF30_11625 [Leifsonia sp. Leaf264]